MGLFDAGSSIADTVAQAIEDLGAKQADAIIAGFKAAAEIIADRLEEIHSND